MNEPNSKKITIMVSSSVYGIEELLDRIYSLLTAYGYEVWMSHKGTLPVLSDRTAFENCLAAVDRCDLFLGLITPQYGSGRDNASPQQPSITHSEMRRAIELGKPRWILAHDHVVFAWSLLKNIEHAGGAGRTGLRLRRSPILDDLRVLDLYEEAIIQEKELAHRTGNWVQKFRTNDDGCLFVGAQFYRYQEVEDFIRENFAGGSPVNSAEDRR